ncbi:MAG: hypothetical protein FWH20_03310 [Oscillospiraceae bacterium]|nr:hypothetical protein [Oscillospiraceae bacterium]
MKSFLIRIITMLIGLMLFALGIILTIRANIGNPPWEVFHAGLVAVTGITLGTATIITGFVVVIIVTLMGEKFGIGTIGSMVLTGIFMDIIILLDFIPTAQSFVAGLVTMLVGMFILALGSYFYMKSAFGVGPRDNLMVVLARKTKLPVGLCRGMVEAFVAIIGWLLGGPLGVGTLIAAVAIGFCVQITFLLLRFDVTAVKHETLRETFASFKKKI